MTSLRQHKIDELVASAAEAMEMVDGTTAAEVTAAAFTLVMRVVAATLEIRPDLRHECWQASQILMLQCADDTRPA